MFTQVWIDILGDQGTRNIPSLSIHGGQGRLDPRFNDADI